MKYQSQNLYSNEVEEILGTPPGFLLKWGIWSMVVVFLLLLLGAWIFHYPRKIDAPVVLYTQNPPVEVVSRSNGAIESIFVKHKDIAHKGDRVAVLRSTANTADVFRLMDYLRSIDSAQMQFTPQNLPPSGLNLGTLHDDFARFSYAYFHFLRLVPEHYFQNRNQLLNRKASYVLQELQLLDKQIRLMRQKSLLSQRQFQRDSSLYAAQVISAAQYQQAQEKWLDELAQVRKLEATEARLQNEQHSIGETKEQLGFQRFEHYQQAEKELVSSFHLLKRELSDWKNKYLLEAPSTGVVNFSAFWYANQFVKEGETVFALVPPSNDSIKGRVKVPAHSSGLIRPGQLALVKLDNYPYLEFGVIRARVNWISEVPENGKYTVELHIATPFVTNFGKEIPFQQELSGKAEIITEKQRLLVRLIAPLRWLLSSV